MKANLCVIYHDLNKPVVIVDTYPCWADANLVAQKLNSKIDLMADSWYFKAIQIR